MFGWKTHISETPRRMTELSGAWDGTALFSGYGMLSGTHVASNLGWSTVDAIAAGDMVLTFDHGMQMVVEVRRTTLFAEGAVIPDHMRPVTVPVEALGNRTELTLLPEQGVMVECDAASDAQGDPFAIVPAGSLVGFRGIRRASRVQDIEIVTLYFAQPEVIYAEGGTLVYCPQAHLALTDMIQATAQPYDVLTGEDAAFLVECMLFEDERAAHATTPAPTHVAA